MLYLAHSAHAQLGALPLGLIGCTLLAVSVGLVQWRVWTLSDFSTISSGVAWVGIWRACFFSHDQVTPAFMVMYCSAIGINDSFTPPEIASAQILMFLSLGAGLFGYITGLYGLRNAFFGIKSHTCFAFHFGGALILLAAILALIPLLWNVVSVATNQTIAFPPDFKLPQSPHAQQVGAAIWAGLVGVALLVITAFVFCRYKLPTDTRGLQNREGKDNAAFEADEERL